MFLLKMKRLRKKQVLRIEGICPCFLNTSYTNYMLLNSCIQK